MKLVREHINERFSDKSDPVQDMNIGLYKIIKDYADKKVAEKDYSWIVTAGWPEEIKNDPDLDEETKKEWIEFMIKYRKERLRKSVEKAHERAKQLSDKFVNEKFSEEGDPVRDMGIGLKQQIQEFIKEYDNEEDVDRGFMTPAMFISATSDLNDDVKKAYIEYLIKAGKENIFDWEEQHVQSMIDCGVQFFPGITYFPDTKFKLKQSPTGYVLMCNDWDDFANYYELRGDVDEVFVANVLRAEGGRYFEYLRSNFDAQDILDSLDNNDQQKMFAYIQPICVKKDESFNDASDLHDLFSMFESNNNFHINLIKRAMYNSFGAQMASNEEEACRKDLINAITFHLRISKPTYKKEKLYMNITQQGITKLFLSYYFKDHGIPYEMPKYGYASNDKFNMDFFEEEFEAIMED